MEEMLMVASATVVLSNVFTEIRDACVIKCNVRKSPFMLKK